MSIFRGFIAIDLKKTPEITTFSQSLKNIQNQMKLVNLETIHVTLKFLGDTEIHCIPKLENVLQQSVQNIFSFPIYLQGTGVFPSPNSIKIIWIGIQNSDPITQISHQLDNLLFQHFNIPKEKKPFTPHLTIARVKNIQNKQQLLQVIQEYKDTCFAEQYISSIQLKESILTLQGPIYNTLKEISLQKETL